MSFTALIVIALRPALSLPQKVAPLSYEQARPVLSALEESLPDELKGKSPSEQEDAWAGWLSRYRETTRARLAQGDEDSLVNFLLYGTSFTKQRRLSPDDFKSAGAQAKVSPPAGERPDEIIRGRVDDLIQALSLPGGNERLLFLRGFLEEGGQNVSTQAGRAVAKNHVFECLIRVLKESQIYAEQLQAARRAGNATEEFAERSTLFRNRGISLDTSLLPDFAIEESLRAMRDRGLIEPGRVQKVAVLGPGLDFTDKDAGFDLYPVQTIQPFALMDSLLRLGLAHPDRIDLTVLDLSPRVIAHIKQSRQRAARGGSYTIHLLRDSRLPWKPEPVHYWKRFGDQIGQVVPPASVPAGIPGLEARAIRIRPALVSRLQPAELNIVTQHLDLPDADRFDLMIATNIFVYYGIFEQSLALANVERMLRPGGFLLSNNALLELPISKIHAVDYQTVIYSDRRGDGDHIVWLQRIPEPDPPRQ